MYQSPDFIKIPVKLEDSFASYFCNPDNRTVLRDSGYENCIETPKYETFIELNPGEEFACYNKNAAPY